MEISREGNISWKVCRGESRANISLERLMDILKAPFLSRMKQFIYYFQRIGGKQSIISSQSLTRVRISYATDMHIAESHTRLPKAWILNGVAHPTRGCRNPILFSTCKFPRKSLDRGVDMVRNDTKEKNFKHKSEIGSFS